MTQMMRLGAWFAVATSGEGDRAATLMALRQRAGRPWPAVPGLYAGVVRSSLRRRR